MVSTFVDKLLIFSNEKFTSITLWIKDYFFLGPLKRLYFFGPDLKSLGIINVGFWNGLTNSEICAKLTSIPESHWDQNSETCNERIDRQFMAFVIIIEFSLYICTMIYLTNGIYKYYFPDPLTREIREFRKWIIESMKKKR